MIVTNINNIQFFCEEKKHVSELRSETKLSSDMSAKQRLGLPPLLSSMISLCCHSVETLDPSVIMIFPIYNKTSMAPTLMACLPLQIRTSF